MKSKKNNNKGQLLLFPDPGPEEAEPPASPVLPAGQATDLADGRDELNLAEFPLTAIGDRPPAGIEVLEFADQIFDSGAGQTVTRTLRVVGAAQLGLPASPDGDVLLALIQLTRWRNGFADRVVPFTRYEAMRLLGWPDNGAYYRRLADSLNRWVGVTLFYERAWWDRRQQTWVDEKFHVLERVSLRRRGEAVSTFTWNEVVFSSFKAENLKRLDLRAYFGLRGAVSRRLYRFLDKRFLQRPNWSFDLTTFACEHVGLSRRHRPHGLRRCLAPALRELEEAGFLTAVPDDVRYQPAGHGRWRLLVMRQPPPEGVLAAGGEGRHMLERRLVERGVAPAVAAALVASHPAEHIRTRLDVLDWLVETGDGRVRNPAGYLVHTIREGFAPPAGFTPAAARAAAKQQAEAAATTRRAQMARLTTEADTAHHQEFAALDAYLAALDQDALAVLDAEALTGATPFLAERYRRAVAAGAATAPAYLVAMRYDVVRRRLAASAADGAPPPLTL